jgi:hypothetical protein
VSSTVKPTCAVALSLLVWYLLLPPLRHNGTVNAHAHLSKWKTLGVYDTHDKCKTASSDLKAGKVRHELNYPSKRDTAKCVAADDRRLKEK